MTHKLKYFIVEEPGVGIVKAQEFPVIYYFQDPPQWFLDLLSGKLVVKEASLDQRRTAPYPHLRVVFTEKEKESHP